MYFGSGVGRLSHAIKTLRMQWEQTADTWRDEVRRDFEDRQIAPLDTQTTQTIRAMDDLADLFAKIYRDCS
ncbi:MAG TPA: hypothetical protein VFT74_12990 [Isosphaeraceae bacterium]|nr:hypothetical protein [Isosphaeraceae bacterium]